MMPCCSPLIVGQNDPIGTIDLSEGSHGERMA
jgi:hypothetical protein